MNTTERDYSTNGEAYNYGSVCTIAEQCQAEIARGEAMMDEERERLQGEAMNNAMAQIADRMTLSRLQVMMPNRSIPSQGATRDRGIQGIVGRRDKPDKVNDCDK